MLHIGCHLSCSNGYLAMGRQALEIGADVVETTGGIKPFSL